MVQQTRPKSSWERRAEDAEARIAALRRDLEALEQAMRAACPAYRPDHNGECLTCDDWAEAHPSPQDFAIRLADILARHR